MANNKDKSLHKERFHATGDKPKYSETIYEFAEEFSDGPYGASPQEDIASEEEKLGIDVEREQQEKQMEIKATKDKTD